MELDFPVFSAGYSSRDIKCRGTLESINDVIQIEGIKIYPEDLIFADNDGVVVIPKDISQKIIDKAIEIISKEKRF